MSGIKSVKKWHSIFLWPALIATLIYILSALSHPLMVWTGPQAKKMYPPALLLKGNEIEAIAKIVKRNSLGNAKIAKFVPYKDQVLFQVSEENNKPRRYFTNTDLLEVNNHDRQQAIWLASHYLGESLNIRSIEFQTQFDEQYPLVNRLLPVYKINFNTDDNLTVYIHTETQALAAITNDWKQSLRWVFQNLHSFEFLSEFEGGRLLLIFTMVSLITLMAVTGIIFLLVLKRRSKVVQAQRRWHRRLAYVVSVPLIMFSISGIYHLLHMSLEGDSTELLTEQAQLPLSQWGSITLPSVLVGKQINQISLVNQIVNGNEVFLYRISASVNNPLEGNSRAKRFKGASKETQGYYIDSHTAQMLDTLDQQIILEKAEGLFNGSGSNVANSQKITHFGPTYDFRNKRLPVWQVNSDEGLRIFIDPISNQVVDYNYSMERIEGYSFSFLHKWNLLVPLIGRFYRDVAIVVVLSLSLILSLLGLFIYLKNKQRSVTIASEKEAMVTS